MAAAYLEGGVRGKVAEDSARHRSSLCSQRLLCSRWSRSPVVADGVAKGGNCGAPGPALATDFGPVVRDLVAGGGELRGQ